MARARDGIGAVIKRPLRKLERLGSDYCNGPRDVFVALITHAAQHLNEMGSSVAISSIVYHHILTDDEPALEHPNVWSAIQRPQSKACLHTDPGNLLHL